MNEPNVQMAVARLEQPQGVVTQQQVGGVIRLADKLDAVVESFKEYTKACEALLTRDDYQGIGNRQFKKKSAWRKIATAFNVSTQIVKQSVEYDEDGRIHHAEFVVRAIAPNGRQAEAWAGASRVDRDYSHDQDVAATAQTRATNRAIADLIGCGEVSAEEMLEEKKAQRQEPKNVTPPRQQQQQTKGGEEVYPVCTVLAVKEVHSKPDAPKAWTAYFITFNDTLSDIEAATFDKKIAALANELANTGENAAFVVKPGRKPNTKEIVSLTRSEVPPGPDSDPVPMEYESEVVP